MRALVVLVVVAGICCCGSVHAQPPSAKRELDRAISAMNAGRYPEAEKTLRQLVRRYPSYDDARYELALVLSLQQRFDDAIGECKILCDTSRPKERQRDLYFQLLGNLYAQKDDTANADATYRLGVQRFPTSARLHVEIAIRHAMHGDLDEALDEIETAISGDPTYPLSYYWGARFYRASSERIWAIFYAEIFLNLRPNSPKADEISSLWYNLFREAVEQFDQEGRIVLSREIRGTIGDGAAPTRPFAEAYTEVLTDAARQLRFNRDFELPVASIDTMLTRFVELWHERGYDRRYSNVVIERYRQLRQEGLLSAYVHVLAQHGKPMQYEEYAKHNRDALQRLERWIERNRLIITRDNYISRYR